MRYSVAVDRLRSVAETCTRLASLWEDDPLVVDAYVFGELLAGGQRLQRVDAAYWEREWRRDHKGLGIYPEDQLWRATHGYLDLLAASQTAGSI